MRPSYFLTLSSFDPSPFPHFSIYILPRPLLAALWFSTPYFFPLVYCPWVSSLLFRTTLSIYLRPVCIPNPPSYSSLTLSFPCLPFQVTLHNSPHSSRLFRSFARDSFLTHPSHHSIPPRQSPAGPIFFSTSSPSSSSFSSCSSSFLPPVLCSFVFFLFLLVDPLFAPCLWKYSFLYHQFAFSDA